MFSKKKEGLEDFPLQVLTTSYIIDGTVPGDTCLYFPTVDADSEPLVLANARLRAALPGGPPDHTCGQFSVMGGPVVALVPGIDPHSLSDWSSWKQYNKPRAGVFYLGPYVMEGTLMFLRKEYLEEEMPILDVRIHGAVPGAAWGQVAAPFALLNIRWLHGWEHS